MENEIIIKEIAKILIKEEVPNWSFGLISESIRNKYLKKSEEIVSKLLELGYLKDIITPG